MKRKIVSCALVATLSFYIGCYSTGTITKEELKGKVEQVDITVYTKDSLEYEFPKENYRIQGDTLSGAGVQKIWDAGWLTKRPFQGSISFSDITALKAEEFDVVLTIVAVVLPPAILFGGFIAILASTLR